MAFDWREFLTIAKELAKDGREGASRISISRAYYCTYHLGLAYATTQGFKEPQQSAHRALWEWYENRNDKTLKTLGIEGNRLKYLRVKVDYKADPIPRLSDVVSDTLRRAEAFKNNLP